MFNNIFVLAFVAGLCFAGWPIVIRGTNLDTIWVAILISLGASVFAICIAIGKKVAIPPTKELIIGIIAGLINGFGFLLYSKLITTKSVQLSIALPLVAVTLVIFVAVAGFIIYKEPITLKKAIGLIGAITAVAFLN